jgi:hypothetical protein
MNRLSLIAIGGSLVALVAAAPVDAKTPAPLPIQARVAYDDSTIERSQLEALWTVRQSCPADAAVDFRPQRRSDRCVNAVAFRETRDTPATAPKTDK